MILTNQYPETHAKLLYLRRIPFGLFRGLPEPRPRPLAAPLVAEDSSLAMYVAMAATSSTAAKRFSKDEGSRGSHERAVGQ